MSARNVSNARWVRAVVLGLLVGLAGVLTAPAVEASPVQDLSGLPAELQKYVPGSAGWVSSPWMTSPGCRDRGGDFSSWAASVMGDTPSLLAFFQASSFGTEVPAQDRPRNEAILAGYRVLATELRPPAGYCVDDLRRWAGEQPQTVPLGFPWGVTFGDGHRSGYYCTDRAADATPQSEVNRWLGAERVPCDGLYVSCANADQAEKSRCEAWNAFSDSYVRRVEQLRSRALALYPASGRAATDTRLKSPEELLADVAGNWFQELTVNVAQAATSVMAEAMTFWTRSDQSSSLLSGPAVTQVQGMLRYVGIVLLVGSMMWQGVLMMYRRKLDPLVGAATGLLSFAGWSTLAGSLAILLDSAGTALADQVLDRSSTEFSNTMGLALQASIVALPGAVLLLSIILFFLGCVQWVLGFFRMGALVILLGLVPMAAAGQLNESTKPWLRKVLSWCLSLILYKPIAAIVFAVGLTLMEGGNGLSTILVGMAVLALAVIAMPTMLRFFDWGGQRLTGSGGGGGAMAAGAAASVLGGGGAGAFARFMDHRGPASGNTGRSSGAVGVSSSHAGDGPGRGVAGGETAAAAAPTGTGPADAPGRAAAAGPVGGSTGGAVLAAGPSGASATTGAASGSASAGAVGASAVGAGAAGAAGGAAAAAGPAGAAVVGAQVVRDAAGRAGGAMTEGVDAAEGSS
jgi:hypothetical protein